MDWGRITAALLDAQYPYEQTEERIIPKLKEIDALRREKNAVILAHYYQIKPIQLIADVKGDSLALAMAARNLNSNLVVSCTVNFMAEMVKLLSPESKVVIPGLGAGCSIADGMNGATVQRIRSYYPDAAIIAYINTNIDVKAAVDSVCTSANAKTIVERIQGDPVIMLPDSFFAKNIFKQVDDERTHLVYEGIAGSNIVMYDPNAEKTLIFPLKGTVQPQRERGTCVVHEQFTPEDVAHYRKVEKVDLVLAHPEVSPEVAAAADYVGGTGKMIDIVGKSAAKRILYLSECDLAAPLMEAYPKKEFVTPCKLCPYMKKNTLDGVLYALQEEKFEVILDPALVEGAKKSLETMFALTA